MPKMARDIAASMAARKKGDKPDEYGSALEEVMSTLADALARKDSKAAARAFKEANALCAE